MKGYYLLTYLFDLMKLFLIFKKILYIPVRKTYVSVLISASGMVIVGWASIYNSDLDMTMFLFLVEVIVLFLAFLWNRESYQNINLYGKKRLRYFTMYMLNGLLFFLKIFILYTVIACVDITIGTLFQLINKNLSADIFSNKGVGVLASGIAAFLWYVLAKYINGKYVSVNRMSKRYYFIFTGMVLIDALLISFGMELITQNPSNKSAKSMEVLLTFMVLGMLGEIVLLIATIKEKDQYKNYHILNQEYLKIQEEHYQKLMEEQEKSRRFKHDVKNHIYCIEVLSKEGSEEELKHYLKEVNDNLEDGNSVIETGNLIVNAILNDKYAEAKKQGINLIVCGKMPETVMISSFDLCTIFANGISNAIEACCNLDIEKNIQVEIMSTEVYIMIRIVNPIFAQPIKENNIFFTLKQDKKNHGFGLKNIEESIKKYQGKFAINYNKEEFQLEIILRNSNITTFTT